MKRTPQNPFQGENSMKKCLVESPVHHLGSSLRATAEGHPGLLADILEVIHHGSSGGPAWPYDGWVSPGVTREWVYSWWLTRHATGICRAISIAIAVGFTPVLSRFYKIIAHMGAADLGRTTQFAMSPALTRTSHAAIGISWLWRS